MPAKRHGMHNSLEYHIWEAIIQRCRNPKDRGFKHYGARGIQVCDAWLDFVNFYQDMGPRPSPKHSIDRRDNNGPYSPDNCRWATLVEQHSNTRRNILITWRNETYTLSEWARRTGINRATLHQRLKHGWNLDETFTSPASQKRPHSHDGCCKRGHPYADHGYIHPVSKARRCRICMTESNKRYRERQK